MTRALHFSMPFSRDHFSSPPQWRLVMPMSSGILSKRHALTYRQHFAERWSGFIRSHFDSPEAAAVAFGVDGSTARKWWAGSNAPSGFVVAMAYDAAPVEARDALGVRA